MALVIICGQPASGKSTFAEDLQKQVEQHGKECRVISEDSLGLPRDQAYRGGCSFLSDCSWVTLGRLVTQKMGKPAVLCMPPRTGIPKKHSIAVM